MRYNKAIVDNDMLFVLVKERVTCFIMYKILRKEALNPTVTLMEIEAPLIAKKASRQFIILRVDENGERIPLTVAGYDREKGSVTIIFQIVGGTTEQLNHLNEGDCLHDFVGPLGTPTETEGYKKVCIIGGGVAALSRFPLHRNCTIWAAKCIPSSGSVIRTW